MQKNTESVIRRAFILLIFCLFHFQTAYALDVNGLISDPTRWSTADSPVNITGNVRVAATATLTIDAGVTVIFKSSPDAGQGYSIKTDGTLTAMGDPMDPIIFTAADPSVPWGSITFEDGSADWDAASAKGCAIEYCVIEYGGNDPDSGSMISAFNAMPRIANNVIRFGVAAGISAFVSDDPATISSLSGDIQITANQIHSNPTGLRLSAEGGVIENNYFLNNNRAMDVQTRSNDLTIRNNTVVSSAPELFGTGLRLILDERSNGITAYQWRQISGTPVTLSNPESARTAFVTSDPGSKVEKLQFELAVTDEQGNQSAETITITITGDNPPPQAQAGADGNVQLPQEAGDVLTITLSGAGSSDPFLGIAAYSWKQTAGKTVNLQNAETINPSFIVPDTVSAGDRMTFELTVTDQGGLTATDSVSITYYNDNIFPVAVAGDDRRVSQGETVFLNGTGSSDADGSIVSYSWTQTNGPEVALINPNSATPYFEAPADNTTAETFGFRLRVTDNGGLQGVDDIAVTVYGPLIAAIGATSTGDIVILDGSASVDTSASADITVENNHLEMNDPDAGLFALSALDNSAFTLAIAGNNFQGADNEGYLAYTYNWSENAPQIVEMPENWWGSSDARVVETLIYDQAVDYQLPEIDFQPIGGKAYPDAGASLSYPPIANAGPDQETAADNLVTLDGSGSYDPDGIARYEWQQTDGTPVTLRDSGQPTATFIAPNGGTDGTDGTALQFTLTVATDNTFSHTDTITVTVVADEPIPEVDVDACFIGSAQSGAANPWLPQKASAVAAAAALLMAAVVFFRRRQWRKLMPVIFLLMAAVFLSATVAEAGYFAAGGGSGGDADEVNATIETGAKDIYFHNLDLLFGAGVFFIPHSDNDLPSPTIALPCPNNECVPMDNVRKGTEVGFVGKLGIEIGTSNVYVSAIGGFTAYTESELSRSTATGRVYEDSSDSKIDGVYGGGVSYFMDYKWSIVFQVDYDNIRGVTGTIGWHW